jgi:hypothetical protein
MLLQEEYRNDPWMLLVGCVLLNQTTRKQVDGVRDELFELWPCAEHLAAARPEWVADCVRSCGLMNRRARTLKKLSQWWIENLYDKDRHKRILDLEPPGVGEYAADSYRIFVVGPNFDGEGPALRDEEWPHDKELNKWFQSCRAVASMAYDSIDYCTRLHEAWDWQLKHPGEWTS